ncbi:MAG: hypothetical protein K9J80_16925 [Sulfuritalea sp.]|nr:hypothetical protein [Sulfuritalea sp.]
MNQQPQITVPRHLKLLGQALTPGLNALEKRVRKSADDSVFDQGLADLVHSLQTWRVIIGRIDECSELLMREIVTRPDISECEIYRQVGRFEGQLLDPLLAASALLYSPEQGVHALPLKLWDAVSLDVLSQIWRWLDSIRQVLLDPEAAYQTGDFSMEGEVALFEFNLKLSLPPEMQQLQEWVLERAAESKNQISRNEHLAETRFSDMSRRDSTDDLGRAIVKLLGWILLLNVLDGD